MLDDELMSRQQSKQSVSHPDHACDVIEPGILDAKVHFFKPLLMDFPLGCDKSITKAHCTVLLGDCAYGGIVAGGIGLGNVTSQNRFVYSFTIHDWSKTKTTLRTKATSCADWSVSRAAPVYRKEERQGVEPAHQHRTSTLTIHSFFYKNQEISAEARCS